MNRLDPENLLECLPRVMVRVVDNFAKYERCYKGCQKQEGDKKHQFRKSMKIG
jgi:hypothetical protein